MLVLAGCKKDDAPATTDFQTLKRTVLVDFSTHVALASYKDLRDASLTLNASIQALETAQTGINLTAAQNDWKAMRGIWEQCEGFLFGPVDVNEYDPYMDTWPTDYTQIDSLISSRTPLEVTDIEQIPLSLRGYHPLEYLLFGQGGSRQPGDFTPRQLKYMSSLTTDISNTCTKLYGSWAGTPENYAVQVAQSGTPQSAAYPKMQNAYLDIVDGMAGICEEVGEAKIKDPYDARDPQVVESPYSGNSWTDFENNLRGLQNVYLGHYKTHGLGLADLVAAKNKALDTKMQGQINAAISSFATVKAMPFEQSILSAAERSKIQRIMDALATLKTTLEDELRPFVLQYITD